VCKEEYDPSIIASMVSYFDREANLFNY
jgi:hypothetical protein